MSRPNNDSISSISDDSNKINSEQPSSDVSEVENDDEDHQLSNDNNLGDEANSNSSDHESIHDVRQSKRRLSIDYSERESKRQKIDGFGPKIETMNKEEVASTRYSFFDYIGMVGSKQWQLYKAVAINSSSNVIAIDHCYSTELGEVCIVSICRANNGVVVIHGLDPTRSLARLKLNEILGYIGPATQLQIELGGKQWRKLVDDQPQPSACKISTPSDSPYKPPQQEPVRNITEVIQPLQQRISKLENEVGLLNKKLTKFKDYKQKFITLENSIEQMNRNWMQSFDKLKKYEKKMMKKNEKMKKSFESMPPPQMTIPSFYPGPPQYPPMPMPVQHHYPHHY